jgi:hypothetical protein
MHFLLAKKYRFYIRVTRKLVMMSMIVMMLVEIFKTRSSKLSVYCKATTEPELP